MTPSEALSALTARRAADAELREKAEKATPGPWFAHFTAHAEPWVVTDRDRPAFSQVAQPNVGVDDYGRANALFIAALSPTVVLRMLDWNERVYEADEALLARHGSNGHEGRIAHGCAVCGSMYAPGTCPDVSAVLARYLPGDPT